MPEHLEQIALRISDMREIRGISQEEMALQLNMPVEEYRDFEAGKKDFRFTFLYKICEILGAEINELLVGETPTLKHYEIVRAGQGKEYKDSVDYPHRNLAFAFKNRKADPFIVTITSDVKYGERKKNNHESQELIYILEGKMLLDLDAHTLVLDKGDSIYFDSTQPHAMYALECDACTFLTIVMK